jgi:polysaccharide export outer membrane protein
MSDAKIYEEIQNADQPSASLVDYIGLVKRVALHLKTCLPNFMELGELLQVGMLGLIQADKSLHASKAMDVEASAVYMKSAASSRLMRAGMLTSMSILTSCMVVPGAHISVDGVTGVATSQKGGVDLIPITQDLIREMQSQQAWVVQVASFVDRSKAKEMQKILALKGFSVFSKSVHINGENHLRVFIGPKSDKSSAQAIKQKVDSQFGTQSIVLNSPEADSESNMALQGQMEGYTYRVGAGDVLNITVWDHPELTIPQSGNRPAAEAGNVVHKDGAIFYPYVGTIPVVGRHVTEIREIITRGLGRYITEPQVDVSVAAFRSQRVFITGAVKDPSTVPVTDVPMTLLGALNACGGLAPDADWRSVTLTSTRGGELIKETLDLSALYQRGVLSQNRLLGSNDVLHVPRNDALKVFVMGDVIKANTQRIDRSGLTLAEALNNVGGINEATADASGIFVLRASDKASKLVDIYQLDASMGPMLVLSTQFRLQPMDIVYVTSMPIARWNKLLTQLTSSLGSFYQIDRINKGS